MTERTICFVYTRPVDGRESEYNEWYDRQHLRDVARIPGVVSAQRYDAVAGGSAGEDPARCLAIYEISADPGDFVQELRARFGTEQMPTSDALDLTSVSMTFWKPRGERVEPGR